MVIAGLVQRVGGHDPLDGHAVEGESVDRVHEERRTGLATLVRAGLNEREANPVIDDDMELVVALPVAVMARPAVERGTSRWNEIRCGPTGASGVPAGSSPRQQHPAAVASGPDATTGQEGPASPSARQRAIHV